MLKSRNDLPGNLGARPSESSWPKKYTFAGDMISTKEISNCIHKGICVGMTQHVISYCISWRSTSMCAIAGLVILSHCSGEKEKTPAIDYLGQNPPGMVATLFAPGLISTNAYEHSAPAFSPDGSVVLWTVVDKNYRASMMQMKYEQGKWSSPARPSFADSTADDYYPSFSPNGKKLYFGSRRKVPSGYPGTDMRFWEVERNEGDWKKPQPFDTIVSKGREFAASIAENGTLYFSVRPDEGRNMNLLKAEIKNGNYTEPVLLPFNINSVDYEDGPYIAPDESFLIMESQRPEGIGGSLDLYISFKVSEDRWTIPVNMGPKINTVFSERFARLSPDGKYLFFGSSRNQSADNIGFDIYWIDARVIAELKNETSLQRVIDASLGQGILDALSKKENERSAVLLKRWLDNDPNNLDATVVYIAALRKLKRYAEAEKLLDSIPSTWNGNTNIVMEKGLVRIGSQKDEEAEKILSSILGDGEQQRDRYLHLSNELLEMGMFQKSDKYFTKAMTVHSNMYDFFRRARTYALVGEKDKTIELLQKAIDLGYTSREDIENDKSFALLKSDARWKKLLSELK
jgi:Tol biopolymer transport system component